ncbi:MMPL family transporter [Subtercola boreus]|uniref:MMPL family transporter n=1 Tax=Subtercola boreus TaxID=120213 RepID=UPI001C0E8FE6|nr:MMPL family transporter [Subtercola boreus]
MAVLLYRIGAFAARRHFLVMGVWLLIVVAAVGGALAFPGKGSAAVEIPGTQSQTAIDLLGSRFPAANGGSSKVIFVAPSGQSIRSFESQISGVAAQMKTLPGQSSVTDPFDTSGAPAVAAAAAAQIAPDNSMAYISIAYSVPAADLTDADTEALESMGDSIAENGLTVAYAGVKALEPASDPSQEAGSLVVALIILAITIGSLLAAGMPLITAIFGVAISTSSITIVSDFVTISSSAPILAQMLGLAVGIDYSLFIVSRHRSQLAAGVPARESVAIANSTAGSAVVFAGITVIIALIGLSVVNIPFLSIMGLGAAFGVLLAVAAALTLLPAILGLLNTKLVPRPDSRTARREREMQNPAPGTKPTLGRRWVRVVTRRPLITVVIVPLALLALAFPALHLALTVPDAGYQAPGSQARVAYDLLDAGYGPGFNGPLLITADIGSVEAQNLQAALDALGKQFTGIADVDSVSPVIPNSALDMAIVSLTPSSGPDSDATKQLVQTLRNDAPAFEAANGFTYMVTGQTAVAIDISTQLGDALPIFALVVVGLCLVLLTMVFRSLAVPISATLGFLLSVGASLGVVTLVFNDGVLADLLGVQKVGPVISFMPILVMAVLFGLAMDYHVFLVSRMREEFSRTGEGRASVLDGFSAAARVVTAAALIMFSVFASFVPGSGAAVQPLAFALAVGVLIDAFLVRMTLIPAVMAMLGTRAWYLPAWLGRHLPNVDIEGEKVHELIAARDWRPGDAEAAALAHGSPVPDDRGAGAAGADASTGASTEARTDGGADGSAGATDAATDVTAHNLAARDEAPAPVTRSAAAAERRMLAKAAAAEAKAARKAAREAQLAPLVPRPAITDAVAAGSLTLAGQQPFDLAVESGGIALVFEEPGAESHLGADVAGAAVLAALTGRLPRFAGHLSVLGHPQPFEASALRRRARLVVDADGSALTVGEYLLGEVRLDAPRGERPRQLERVGAHLRVLEDVVAGVADAGAPATASDQSTQLTALGVPARWCIDVALALASSAELIAIDLRSLPSPLVAELLAAVAAQAGRDVTLVCAVQGSAAGFPQQILDPHRGGHADTPAAPLSLTGRSLVILQLAAAPIPTEQGALV